MAGNLLACPRPYKSKFALDDSEVVVCTYTCSMKTVAKKCDGVVAIWNNLQLGY